MKCVYTNLDYLTFSIESKKPSGIMLLESFDHRSSHPIVKRNEKILNEDLDFKEFKEHFNLQEHHSKNFRDPTNKFQACPFYDNENGIFLKRLIEKIPVELKGQAFLKENIFYKLKPILKKYSLKEKIKVSRIDICKDYEVPNGIEDIISKKSFKKINFNIPKNKKIFCVYNNGILETVSFGWTSLRVKIYRKDIELENIKNEIKKKRLKQIYKDKKIVRIEISFLNSSKKCQSIVKRLIHSRIKTENIINDLFTEVLKKYYLKHIENEKSVKTFQKVINNLNNFIK